MAISSEPKFTLEKLIQVKLRYPPAHGFRATIALSQCSSAQEVTIKNHLWGFPGGAVVENLPANAGDTGSSPDLGRSHMPRSN